MRLGRLLIILAIVLILGLVAFYAVLNLGGGQGAEGPPQTTDIVIVTQPIARGNLITEESLGFQPLPTTNTISTMLTSKSQAVGKLARFDLEPGVPLMASMVADLGEGIAVGGSDTSLLIPAGMVAFPIPIDRFSSLAYGLRAGDHVNVIATLLLLDIDRDFQTALPNNSAALLAPGFSAVTSSQLVSADLINNLVAQIASGGPESPYGRAIIDSVSGQPFYLVPAEAQRPRLVSQTLIQDIVVLHVGNFFYTDQTGEEVTNSVGQIPSEEVQPVVPPPPDLITLIVSPQDAVSLNYLVYAGAELTLALRPAADTTTATTEAVTLEYLLNTYNIPMPSNLPYGLEPRIDLLLSPTRQDVLPQPAPAQ
jgi:pilus assembly protein CpaB